MSQSFAFQTLFIEHLNELYSAEEQISEILPRVIGVTSSSELRNAFDQYLQEIKHHSESLLKVMQELSLVPSGARCQPIEGMNNEIEEMMKRGGNSLVKDAALIAMIQRLQHFKIAVYGTARTYARHLNHNKAMELLQRSLNEEGEADRRLTRLAEGGVFTTGINEEACKEQIHV